jgi:hypothetical protein
MTDEQFESVLGAALKRQTRPPRADEAAVMRIFARLNGPLPSQKGRTWSRWPGVLLDWQFAPAWPRMAALAGCAVLGFAIVLTGVDRRIDGRSARNQMANAGGLSAAMFEPEPLTGARP